MAEIEDESSKLSFLATGFPSVDTVLDGGFMKKELVILGAFTGIGKSMIAGQILLNIAKQGNKTAYFSLEISEKMIVSRLLGSLSNIKPSLIIKNEINPEQQQPLVDAKLDLIVWEDCIHIYDSIYHLDQVEGIIRSNEYDFVVIDFIQNLISEGTEYERMTASSLRLQKLAKEKDCTIMALSQLSNSAAKTEDLEYKGSGGIAMVADLGFFLSRDKEVSLNSLTLNLRKNRRGVSGDIFALEFTYPGGWINEKK